MTTTCITSTYTLALDVGIHDADALPEHITSSDDKDMGPLVDSSASEGEERPPAVWSDESDTESEDDSAACDAVKGRTAAVTHGNAMRAAVEEMFGNDSAQSAVVAEYLGILESGVTNVAAPLGIEEVVPVEEPPIVVEEPLAVPEEAEILPADDGEELDEDEDEH